MKRQLTRKLSTAEFAHSHSGHGPPPPTVGPGRRQRIPMADAAHIMHSVHLPAPWTVHIHTCLSPISIGGLPPPPRVSPVSARRRAAAARALRQRGMRQRATGRGGSWRERRRRAAAGRRAKTSKMATPCGHQPTYRGAVGLPVIDVWGSVVHYGGLTDARYMIHDT